MQSTDISFKLDFTINNSKTSYYFNDLNSVKQTNISIASLGSVALTGITSFFHFKGSSDQLLTFTIVQGTQTSVLQMSNCFLMGTFDSITIYNPSLLPAPGYYLVS